MDITFDPKIMGGRTCIAGTCAPFSNRGCLIAHGAAFEETSEGYPDPTEKDNQQAIEYAA